MSRQGKRTVWQGFSTQTLQNAFGVTGPPRGWAPAAVYGVVVTAALLTFAVAVNIWIGRTIHWDWVAIFGSLAFAGLTVGRRARIL